MLESFINFFDGDEFFARGFGLFILGSNNYSISPLSNWDNAKTY